MYSMNGCIDVYSWSSAAQLRRAVEVVCVNAALLFRREFLNIKLLRLEFK